MTTFTTIGTAKEWKRARRISRLFSKQVKDGKRSGVFVGEGFRIIPPSSFWAWIKSILFEEINYAQEWRELSADEARMKGENHGK